MMDMRGGSAGAKKRPNLSAFTDNPNLIGNQGGYGEGSPVSSPGDSRPASRPIDIQ